MGPIFLSYAGTDREVATRLKEGLAAAGAHIWQDVDQIRLGDNWIDTLQAALSECSAYAILVGSGGVQRWVKAELSIAIKRHFDSNGAFPIYPFLLTDVEPEDLPQFLSIFQAERLKLEPASGDYQRLAGWLSHGQERVSAATTEALSTVCPFPGLEAYGEDTAGFFFGRQSETLEALALLGRSRDGLYRRWLQVEGPSGGGKSSLVKAGMIPAIRRGWIEEQGERTARNWQIAIMRPGSAPIDNLAAALGPALGLAGDTFWLGDLADRLNGRPDALRYLLRERAPETARFLLLVDQFEELFTLTEDTHRTQREHFEALLASALEDRDGPFHLITTIRSDFTLRLGELPRLESLLNSRAERYYLKRIDGNALRDVVRTPARLAGLTWDEPTLPDRIVADAADEPSPLPLVSNLLRLLWQRRVGNALRARVYGELGGVGGALARSADGLLESFGADSRKRARKLLMELVRVRLDEKPTRQTITRKMALEAAGAGSEAERILSRLSGGADPEAPKEILGPRLIVVSQADEANAAQAHPEDRVDLAHEALLEHWDTLRDWVTQNRDLLEAKEELETAARRWEKDGSPSFPGIPSQNQLARYGRVKVHSETADAYLKAVDGEIARQGRSKVIAWSLLAAAVLLIGSFGVGYWSISEQAKGFNLSGWEEFKVLMMRLGVLDAPIPELDMVLVPKGKFLMGSPRTDPDASENEFEQHEVVIGKPFKIGRYEVTFEEYRLFAEATGRRFDPLDPLDHAGWGMGKRPANVTWYDAQAYARWLALLTGDNYRLPTEAEWEYAARAGTETRYWWGDKVDQDGKVWANCDGCGSEWDGKQTAPVGSFEPNPWGLYDTAGNVWEWTCSPYQRSYEGAEIECFESNKHAELGRRVIRGGSWGSGPARVRSATRGGYSPVYRYGYVGFRLAQDL